MYVDTIKITQVPFSKMKLDWEVTKIHVWMNGITM